MANSEGVAGVDSFLLYGQETAFGTEQTTVNTHLGLVKSFRPGISNNNSYTRGFAGSSSGGRNVVKSVGGTVVHGFSVDMEVLNWDFLEYLLGGTSGSGTITYSETNLPPSATFHRCIDNPGGSSTDQDLIMIGCVLNSVTIKATVGEPIQVTLEWMNAEKKIDTTILSNASLPSSDVFTFAGASIELPNATALDNIIDSLEITITNNFEMLYGLGSRIASNAIAKARDYKISFSVKYLDNALQQAVLGSLTPGATTEPTEYATIECNFVKGGDSAAFLFTGFVFDDHNGNETLNEAIGEELSGTAYSLTVTEVQA